MKKHLILVALFTATTLTAPMANAAVALDSIAVPAMTQTLVYNPTGAAQVELAGWTPSVSSLIRLNMRIWGCVGWQIGRYEYIRKYGIDIGVRCPGL